LERFTSIDGCSSWVGRPTRASSGSRSFPVPVVVQGRRSPLLVEFSGRRNRSGLGAVGEEHGRASGSRGTRARCAPGRPSLRVPRIASRATSRCICAARWRRSRSKGTGQTVLDPLAYPTTVFSVEVLAFMPAVQRERAGSSSAWRRISRSRPAPVVLHPGGQEGSEPLFEIWVTRSTPTLRAGSPTCRSLCTGWSCSRAWYRRQVPSAAKVLARLYSECDDLGSGSCWLRVLPKRLTCGIHYFPLEDQGRARPSARPMSRSAWR